MILATCQCQHIFCCWVEPSLLLSSLGKCSKNPEKVWSFAKLGGGRVSDGSKMPNFYFGKVFFQLACRIILGPPKHVLHLVWSCLNIYLALKTTLKVSLLALLCWLFWPTMTKNNKWNLFVFEVGPSVKFVSAIKDAIFNKKNGGDFFFWKKSQTGGGGGRGGFDKRPHFFRFFFVHPSLTEVVTKY